MKSLLLLALGLARTVVLGARIEAERIVVSVRPYKREQRRCPVCGRACDFYGMANRGAPRLWRAMDLARSACYLEYAPCRVRCSAAVNITGGSRKPSTRKYPFPASDPIGIPASSSVRISL